MMDNLYDVIVIGGGPAGLTAAIYLARARYRVLVLEKEQFGGQITITHEVVNYPGLGKVSGKALTETMQRQAEAFGAEFLLTEAESLDVKNDVKVVHTSRGDFHCLGILIATGAHPRTVGFDGEEEHKGRGVAYCATCDGEFFTGKEVFVVGGGFAAAEESVFLTKFARHVTILIREEDFTCAAAVADQARNNEKITVLYNTEVEAVSGENGLDYLRYKNNKNGEVTEYRADAGDTFGVFVFAGYAPATALVDGMVDLSEHGYVITDAGQKTSVDGVYAAGDVCIKPLRQVVTATGDGALSATELEKYVAALQRKTGLHPKPPVAKKVDWGSVSAAGAGDSAAGHSAGDASSAGGSNTGNAGEIFTADMKQQLETMFDKMDRKLLLKLYLDNRPVSGELEQYITTLARLSDKLSVEVVERNGTADGSGADASDAGNAGAADDAAHAGAGKDSGRLTPCVRVCLEDGTETGLAFHGVPGGHEFTSFVLGLYNASGPGQALDDALLQEIRTITKPIDLKVLVSLSCTMCPDLVIACQRIAAENPNVTAEAYDLQHFDALKQRYNVMSVPCLVINDDTVTFGKKNIKQLLDLINH